MFNPVLPLMVRVARAELVQSLVCAGYLLLGGAALWLGAGRSDGAWTTAAACLVLIGAALAWWLSHRRAHLIRDTPTARIRSAAQGYVEIVGKAALLPGQSPLTFNGLPACVWYQVLVIDDPSLAGPTGNTWVKESDELFSLEDETGICVIDPDHAEIHAARERSWAMEGSRYRARFLMVGDTLYAMGELLTQRAHDGSGDRRSHVASVLRQWKSDSGAMLARFDRNRDGAIDMAEYQEAVEAAERRVLEEELELRTHPEVHLMRAPRGGYPFILSCRDPDELARRFRAWSWFHAAVAALALSGLLGLTLGGHSA